MRRAVLDTNILVSAALTPTGNANTIMRNLEARQFRCALSMPVYAEYVDVLCRPKFDFPPQLIRRTLTNVRRHGSYFTPYPQPERCPDPDDQPFWDLAVSADAAMVTGNVKDFPDSPRVRTPREFVDELAE